MSLSKVFSYQSWVHAVSGAAGSVIAMTVFYPLDTVRQRLQLEDPEKRKALGTIEAIRQILQEEGIASLYRGIAPTLQSLCISNFVYFYTFHSLKALSGSEGQNALKDLMLASIAGVVNVLTTTPFWVVNTRLKMKGVTGTSNEFTKHYDNLMEGLAYVAKTEGRQGLWSGTAASLMLVSNPALQFMMYELLKRNLSKMYGNLSGLSFFAIGAIAKAFATVMTYPLQLIQTRQRHSGKDVNSKDMSTFDMMLVILKTQGVYGLFRGLEAKILQTVLTAALMFSIYENVAKYVGMLLLRQTKTT